MKRECESSVNQQVLRAVDLPIDLLYPLAWQLDMADTGAVFRFMLICNTARIALQPVLGHWYREMNRIWTEKLPSKSIHQPLGLRIMNMKLIMSVLCIPWPLDIEPEKSPDAVLCLYYTGHCKKLFASGVGNTIINGKTVDCHCTVAHDAYKDDCLRKIAGDSIEYYGHVHWQALRYRFKHSLQSIVV